MVKFQSKIIVPVLGDHADDLYPLIKNSKVTDTIQWNGPTTLQEYKDGLIEREAWVKNGELHMFTIIDPVSGKPAGTIDIRPDENNFRADCGLWIGEKFHGQGLGTKAIQELLRYGFSVLKLEKIEGFIFVGNLASRRVFEKCGFTLEGTIRCRALKNGIKVDEWAFGILRNEFTPGI